MVSIRGGKGLGSGEGSYKRVERELWWLPEMEATRAKSGGELRHWTSYDRL